MQKNEVEIFYPTSQTMWRKWLQENHISKQAVWLVFYNKKSEIKSITWSEAVDEALCFGWIDSKKSQSKKKLHTNFSANENPKALGQKLIKTKLKNL